MVSVFVLWSGDVSRIVGEELARFLRVVVHNIQPFISPEIDAGAVWDKVIAGKLEKTHVGIACLTAENLESPWINFEAGAISKVGPSARVIPFLIGLEPSDLVGPLVRFQAKKADKKGVNELVTTINSTLENPLSEDSLHILFEDQWPTLERVVKEALQSKASASEEVPTTSGAGLRASDDLLREVVDRVRRIEQKHMTVSGGTWGSLVEITENVEFDPDRLEVHRGGETLPLTPREADILIYLRSNKHGVVSREDLLRDVWRASDPRVETRTVDIHIVGLRRKVEPDPSAPTVIQTVRGQGYRWGGL